MSQASKAAFIDGAASDMGTVEPALASGLEAARGIECHSWAHSPGKILNVGSRPEAKTLWP